MPVTFPTSRLTVTVELALGADLTADPATWSWTDITAYVRYGQGIGIQRGGQDERSRSPSQVTLTLDNTSGRFTPRHPTGAYYPNIRRNTPLRVKVDPGTGAVSRGIFYVDEWPLNWDASAKERHVSIVASGILRRLNQGEAPTKSALTRAIAADTDVVAYWSCEDGTDSAMFAEASGGTPLRPFGDVSFAGEAGPSGSNQLPSFASAPNSGFQGIIDPYTGVTAWTLSWLLKVPAAISSSCVQMFFHTPAGTIREWRLWLNDAATDNVSLEGLNSSGTDVVASGGLNWLDAAGASLYDRWVMVSVWCSQSGADIAWKYELAPVDAAGAVTNSGTSSTQTLAALTRADHHPGAMGERHLGHVAVRNVAVTANPDVETAGGFAGETSRDRFERVCAEAGVAYVTDGAAALGEVLGVQPDGSALEVLQEIEATDGGILRESTDGRLDYRCRADLYNGAAALVLDYDQRHVQPGFAPTADDQALRNDVTVSRSGGSSARFTDVAHIAAEGRYEESATINPQTDAALPFHAQWRVGLGTVDDFRYPSVGLNFARTNTLVTSWLACDIGSRVTLANPPDELPPDTIDLLMTGYTEMISPKNWSADLHCVPGRNYQVFTVEGSANTGRLDAEDCQVLAGRVTAATSVLVSMTRDDLLERASPLWSTTAVPYDLDIAGERVTCTAVTNGTATFVGAGTAAHGDNASVVPSLHASTAADDLVLVFAAIRNTAAKVTTPAGYIQLWPADNADSHVKLLGKIAASGVSAPTIAFTGGAAGDTTSAHAATFRRAQCAVHNYGSSTNASAQNVAYPAMATARDNCIVLALAWKQDDYTSVATLAGFTEIGEASTVTGNDQSLTWDYVIQTTAAYIASGSFTVTGGLSAVSKGVVVAIPCDVQTLTVTRAVNSVAKAITADTDVKLWRPNVVAL